MNQVWWCIPVTPALTQKVKAEGFRRHPQLHRVWDQLGIYKTLSQKEKKKERKNQPIAGMSWSVVSVHPSLPSQVAPRLPDSQDSLSCLHIQFSALCLKICLESFTQCYSLIWRNHHHLLPGGALALSVPSFSFLNTAARSFSAHHVPLCRGRLCSRTLERKCVLPPVRPSSHPRLGTTAMRMLPVMWLWLSCQWVKGWHMSQHFNLLSSQSFAPCRWEWSSSHFWLLPALAPQLFIFVVACGRLGFSVTHLHQLHIIFSYIFI